MSKNNAKMVYSEIPILPDAYAPDHHLNRTLDMIESNPEVKSFVYQKLNTLTPYITSDTQIVVLARDPEAAYADENHVISEDEQSTNDHYKYRIAIILKEQEGQIESEGFGHDIFDAVEASIDAMMLRLSELQEEIESPQDRLKAIQSATTNHQIH